MRRLIPLVCLLVTTLVASREGLEALPQQTAALFGNGRVDGHRVGRDQGPHRQRDARVRQREGLQLLAGLLGPGGGGEEGEEEGCLHGCSFARS